MFYIRLYIYFNHIASFASEEMKYFMLQNDYVNEILKENNGIYVSNLHLI